MQFFFNQKSPSTIGGIPIVWLPPVTSIGVFATCLICYYMAVSAGQVKPFPYTTITGCGEKYPQNILFRSVLTPFSIFFAILWLTIYNILDYYSVKYQIKMKNLCLVYYFSLIGCIGYTMAIATIDSGKKNNFLHGFGAVTFFLLWTINMVLVTKYLTKVREFNPKAITAKSLKFKKISITALIIVLIYEILKSIFGIQLFNSDPPELCIAEWSTMLFLCLYVYSFKWDCQGFTYELLNQKTVEQYEQKLPPQVFQQTQRLIEFNSLNQ